MNIYILPSTPKEGSGSILEDIMSLTLEDARKKLIELRRSGGASLEEVEEITAQVAKNLKGVSISLAGLTPRTLPSGEKRYYPRGETPEEKRNARRQRAGEPEVEERTIVLNGPFGEVEIGGTKISGTIRKIVLYIGVFMSLFGGTLVWLNGQTEGRVIQAAMALLFG